MRRLTAFFVACLLCACPSPLANDGGAGGGTGVTGGGAGGGLVAQLTLDDYCDFVTGDGSCALAVSCGLYSDAPSCAAYLATQQTIPLEFCAAARIALDAGTVLFDSHAAAVCQATYAQCGDAQTACSQVLIGAGEKNDDCDSQHPCLPGYYCASIGACPGQCTPQKPGATQVTSPVACADSTFAKPAPDGGAYYVCTARIGLGRACTLYNSCIDGAHCHDDLDGGASCQPPGGANSLCGEPAEFSPWCSPLLGLACQPQLDGGAARCGQRARRGEACGFCVADLRCVTDGGAFGVCGERGQPGETCSGSDDCADLTLTCEGGHCVSLPAEGGSCADSYRCAAGLTCRGDFVDGGYVSVCQVYDAGTPAPSCPKTEYP